MTRPSNDWGGPLAIAFAALAVAGLAVWIPAVPDMESAKDLAANIHSIQAGKIGALLLIAAMLTLLAYARWLCDAFVGNSIVRTGAVILAAGGLAHLVENVLVLIFLSGNIAAHQGLWDVINALSHIAFGLLGLGALVIGRGLAGPGWLRIWSLIIGVLGILAGASGLLVQLEVLVPPFNVLLLIWLIVLGFRPRPTV
ncbi:MAG: hypothetical protein ACJ71Z_04385 [Aeromicrobium sp.]